jgi:hypothetical protein
MRIAKAKKTTEAVLKHLVGGDVDGLLRLAPKSRMSAEEVRSVLAGYPYRPVFPSAPIEKLLDIVEVKGVSPRSWSVNLPLWTKEEGRSDLTLEMHFTDSDTEFYAVEIDDLHVL